MIVHAYSDSHEMVWGEGCMQCFVGGNCRIMAGAKPRLSCRRPCKELGILFLSKERVFSSLNVSGNNVGHFQLS